MSFLSKLAEVTGLKTSETEKLNKMEEKLRTSKAANIDKVEELKLQIKRLESQALKKKQEYDKATGATKRLVGGEIERIFNDLDRLKGRETIIVRNIEQVSVAIAKIEELKAAQSHGVEEDVFDDLALDLEDIFGELRSTDRAAEGLSKVNYDAPEKEAMNIESRLESLDVDKVASEDTPSFEKRLKELEAEEN